MKITKRTFTICVVAVAIFWTLALLAADQSSRDAFETLRADVKTNRTAMIAKEMQLTQAESDKFWPMYRNYRAEVEKATDEIAKLILDYSDEYPNVSEEKAKEMVKRYRKTESQLTKIKIDYLKSFGTVLPATKVFRFAQLDNRYDLAVRVGMASSIPILGSIQTTTKSK